MDHHKGLTIIPHEDLVRAVKNWKKLRKLYQEVCDGANDHAEVVWKSKSIFYRGWCQIKSGIFTPDEWWEGYSEYIQNNSIVGFQKGKSWLPERCYCSNAMAAEDCAKHALEGGTHYLSPRQVNFVHVFKDLEVRGGQYAMGR
ncbi:hypothetical protein VPLG_00171 [Vibrio phage eugene 12A10]|uniref:hypothetical protein n=1 Tax=Vibrio phage eugene 12A10 TaxID=573172 RepID=UPI000351ECDE|nr:hypothetical protein VPLG_00171 [Vibrio phage eugene 12A10]AGN51610.1 hypothetical protein VPLG_00171 [Vibrio phage eugene 12A10]